MQSCLPQVDGGGCAAPSVSLGAPRAPAQHCGAPVAAAGLGAAEAPGPLSLAGRLLGETWPCFQGADRDGLGCSWDERRLPAGRSEDQLARLSGSPCWHPGAVGEGQARRASELDSCSWEAVPDFWWHPRLMLGTHKTQRWRLNEERDVKDLDLGLCSTAFLFS